MNFNVEPGNGLFNYVATSQSLADDIIKDLPNLTWEPGTSAEDLIEFLLDYKSYARNDLTNSDYNRVVEYAERLIDNF